MQRGSSCGIFGIVEGRCSKPDSAVMLTTNYSRGMVIETRTTGSTIAMNYGSMLVK
jgi:hypothetical protein